MPYIAKVYKEDQPAWQAVGQLLAAAGIRRDPHLDYTCGLYDDAGSLMATGSCWKDTLRCFAVAPQHQGEGLLNTVVTHLIEFQQQRGNLHLFLYTKSPSVRFFQTLGFYEIVRAGEEAVFMENRRGGFPDYLARLAAETRAALPAGKPGSAAAVVMNANPFTRGHLGLLERAAAENEVLHLFLVSEDASDIPFPVRRQLVQAGTCQLKNLVLHDSGSYIISQATFPSYFQKDAASVAAGHARIDLAVFGRVAAQLGITSRYVGEEPYSETTALYNDIMQTELPRAGIACHVIPRLAAGGIPISASRVRACLRQGRVADIRELVPESTYAYFQSAAAAPLLARLRAVGTAGGMV